MRPRSRAISPRRSCSSSAEWLMMRASSPSSSSRLTRMRAARLPLGELAGGLHDLAERAAEARRERERHEPARDERQQARERGAAPERPALRLDPLDAAAQARDPDDLARAPDRHRGVQQAHARPSRSCARRARRWPASAPTTSGRPPWFSTAASSAPESRRVGEHAPVAADDRDARVHLARGGVDQAVELAVRAFRGPARPRRRAPSGAPRPSGWRRRRRGRAARAWGRRRAAARPARRRSPPPPSSPCGPARTACASLVGSPGPDDSRAI